MRQKEFLEKLEKLVSATAYKKNPQITAGAIYFVMKQHPEVVGKARTYVKSMKKIKVLLSEKYGWSMSEIHKCFCKVNVFAMYMNKSS